MDLLNKFLLLFAITLGLVTITACSLELINTSTNGKAADVVDANPDTSPVISTDLNVPVKP